MAAAITCARCRACCCHLEVILMVEDDDVPAHLIEQDRWGGWVMRRRDDGWCAALDRATMRCTIYKRRPANCRAFEMGGDDCVAIRAQYGESEAA
jgi:Fe-S-cluster containining protein